MTDINLDDLLQAKAAGSVVPAAQEAPLPAAPPPPLALSPEERRQVDAIKDAIDLMDSGAALQFGAAAQKNIAEFADSVLGRTRLKDSGQAGAILAELAEKIRGFSPDTGGFLKKVPLFGSLLQRADSIKQQYETLAAHVDRIQASLDRSKADMMTDIALFDGLYEKNLAYFKALELYIVAGEEKLQELQEKTLPKLRAQAASSLEPMAAQAVSDFEASVQRFEKKIHDLRLSKMVAIQTAPQIRLIQNTDKELVDRIQSAVYNTIPLWKNQIVIALGLSRQQAALEKTRAIGEMTNELLKRNAALLKTNTIEAAKENERAIVDIETVKKVNGDLVATIEETLRIQKEGRQRRLAAEKELAVLEEQLKKTLLAASDRSAAPQG